MIIDKLQVIFDAAYNIFCSMSKTKLNALNNEKWVGHRGLFNHQFIKENTLEAFEVCQKYQCSIELDIHLSMDNRIIVNHDDDLKRVFNKDLNIHNHTLETIKRTEPKVPTLKEALSAFSNIPKYFIEIKNQKDQKKNEILVRETIDLVDSLNLTADCVLITLEIDIMQIIQNTDSKIDRALVYIIQSKEAVAYLKKNKDVGLLGWHFTYPNLIKENLPLSGVGSINYLNSAKYLERKGFTYYFSNCIDRIFEHEK